MLFKRDLNRPSVSIFWFLLCVTISAAPLAGQTPVVTQTFTLHPGWNAIYLEVDPVDGADPAVLFGDLPVVSLWTHYQPDSRVQYIDDPRAGLWNQPGWRVWVPAGTADRAVNLYRLQAQRGYLIELGGDQARQLTITGRPVNTQPKWQAQAYNLRGFPVDAAAPPRFQDYFAGAPDLAVGEVVRLQRDGQWTAVNPGSLIEPGVAYWVFADKAVAFSGPLHPTAEGEALTFYGDGNTRRLSLQNPTPDRTLTLTWADPTQSVPLMIHDFEAATGEYTWRPFQPGSYATDSRGRLDLRLAVDRTALNGTNGAGVLTVLEPDGTRLWLAVDATDLAAAVTRAKRAPAHHGLWVGNVTIDQVSHHQPVAEGESRLEAVGRPLQYRLIVHVDADGNARLLKQVVQLWREAELATVTDPNNPDNTRLQIVQPGETVLLTDLTHIDHWLGIGLSDGERVGTRISAIGFDFDAQPDEPVDTLPMQGSFGETGNQLSATLTLSPTHPTNPFYHLYHPDHDQRDPNFLAYADNAQGEPVVEEAFAITRQILATFSDESGEDDDAPTPGENAVQGTYQETLTGLHKNPITIAGRFVLRRIDENAVLNPIPTDTEVAKQ